MNRVMFFELYVDDPKRAVYFYKHVFGWEIEEFQGVPDYWILKSAEDRAPGINGGISKRQSQSEPVINYIAVDSVDAYLKKITDAGGEISEPKKTIPTIGYIAICKDTEGITFGLIQPDMAAK